MFDPRRQSASLASSRAGLLTSHSQVMIMHINAIPHVRNYMNLFGTILLAQMYWNNYVNAISHVKSQALIYSFVMI